MCLHIGNFKMCNSFGTETFLGAETRFSWWPGTVHSHSRHPKLELNPLRLSSRTAEDQLCQKDIFPDFSFSHREGIFRMLWYPALGTRTEKLFLLLLIEPWDRRWSYWLKEKKGWGSWRVSNVVHSPRNCRDKLRMEDWVLLRLHPAGRTLEHKELT